MLRWLCSDTPIFQGDRRDGAAPWGSMEQRKFQRFSDSSRVTFSGETVTGAGQLDNLSLGGAAILSNVGISRGDYLSLAIALPDQSDEIEIELAPVRWVKSGCFGVEFIRMGSAPQQRLKQYIDTLERTSRNAA